jgi:hypothetical protein
MSLDLALIGFKGESTAASVFGTLRDRVGSATPWTSEVAIVEHLQRSSVSPGHLREPLCRGRGDRSRFGPPEQAKEPAGFTWADREGREPVVMNDDLVLLGTIRSASLARR